MSTLLVSSWKAIFLISGIILFASTVNSLTGFGFSILAVPFLSLILVPKIGIPLILIHTSVLYIGLFIKSYKQMELGKILSLLAGSIIGIPFGAYVLVSFSPKFLSALIALVTIIMVFLLWLNISKKFTREFLMSMIIGFVSGGLKGGCRSVRTTYSLFCIKSGLGGRENSL